MGKQFKHRSNAIKKASDQILYFCLSAIVLLVTSPGSQMDLVNFRGNKSEHEEVMPGQTV